MINSDQNIHQNEVDHRISSSITSTIPGTRTTLVNTMPTRGVPNFLLTFGQLILSRGGGDRERLSLSPRETPDASVYCSDQMNHIPVKYIYFQVSISKFIQVTTSLVGLAVSILSIVNAE